MVLALIVLGACSMSNEESQKCEPFTIDLTSRPTRSDVGLGDGETSVTKTCDDGVEVTLVFPGDDLTYELRRWSADALRAADPESELPTTIDLHSQWATIDETVLLAERIGDSLGIDTADALSQWHQEAMNPSQSGGDVRSRWLRSTVGIARVEMRVSLQRVSGDSSVHVTLHLAPLND